MKPDLTQQTLLCAYLDLSHVLMALENCNPGEIDTKALEATLADIRRDYALDPNDLEHERDQLPSS